MTNMVEAISDEVLTSIVEWARAIPAIKAVWMFGSRARRDHRPDSDLDLAYELQGTRPNELYGMAMFRGRQWQRELEPYIPVRLDLQFSHPEITSEVVSPAVSREGVLLYSATEGRNNQQRPS